VSLFALAKQQGRHFRNLKQEMDEAGIEPAFDVNKIGATFLSEDAPRLTSIRGSESIAVSVEYMSAR